MTTRRIQTRSKATQENNQKTKSLEVQKIRKSVKDEKVKVITNHCYLLTQCFIFTLYNI